MDLARRSLKLLIAPRVLVELTDIARMKDRTGMVAKEILVKQYCTLADLPSRYCDRLGEVETVRLASLRDNVDVVVMDDVRAARKLSQGCRVPIVFSPFIVFLLFEAGKLTRDEGWQIIQQMATERSWQRNIIFIDAERLWTSH